MTAARFITFEGGEGTGKSTQIRLLAETLRAQGIACVETREPGGSPFAETIRDIILEPTTPKHGPLSEALLFSAARADHLEKTIRPALASGIWVLCDRFADSTRAYQGAAGGLDPNVLLQLERTVVQTTQPDLTVILDLDVAKAFERVAARRKAQAAASDPDDAYESRQRDFHEALRQGFLSIAQAEPARCNVVNAEPEQQTIAQNIWSLVQTKLLQE
ncbi:MAG: dTMP kinase [Pseudomonadota bacterium]